MDKHIYFFGSYNPFSNWYKCKFKDSGLEFNCVEQYMMYQKAMLFKDYEIANKILNSSYDPKLYKSLGRKVKGFNIERWDKWKEQIVYTGCYLKFTQNKDLKEKLLNTVGYELVEASPYDKIWGCGLFESDVRIKDKSNWTGLNLLGDILTELRDDILKEEI